jgi:peroxiredoxin Q/BCP
MAFTPQAAPQPTGPAVGTPAPAFELEGSDGKVHKLADLKGKTVVIAWYPKAMTSGCTAECKSMKESGALINQYDVAYFGASVDEPAANKQFADGLQLDFPLLSDPGKQVATAYGVVTPERQYAARWTYYIGPDGNILFVDKAIRTATAGEDIAAKLAELGVKKK